MGADLFSRPWNGELVARGLPIPCLASCILDYWG